MCGQPLAEHPPHATALPEKVGQAPVQTLRSVKRRKKKVRCRRTLKGKGTPVGEACKPTNFQAEPQLWPDLPVDQTTVEDGAYEPVVLHELPEHPQEAPESGANAFACRPLHLKELVEVINQLVPH